MLKRFLRLGGIFLVGLVAVIPFGVEAQVSSFPDVDSDYKYSEAIEYLKNAGVVSGHDDGLFRPESGLNRAEFLKIVIEQAGIDVGDVVEQCFPDVPVNEWFGKYVCFGKSKGWVQGYPDGLFRPARGVSKVEALKILGEVEGWDFEGIDFVDAARRFGDVDLEQWYGDYLGYAIEKNLIDDEGDVFGPAEEMSRGQISEYVYRTIAVREGEKDFVGTNGVPTEAIDEENATTVVAPGSQFSDAELDAHDKQRAEIAKKVRDEIIATHPQRDELVAYMWSDPFLKGDSIGVFDTDRPDNENRTEVLTEDTWLVYLDLAPQAMWQHPTELIFIDVDEENLRMKYEEGYPVINGYGWWADEDMMSDTDFWIYPEDGDLSRLANMSPDLGRMMVMEGTEVSEVAMNGGFELGGLLAQDSGGRSYKEMYEEERKRQLMLHEDEGAYEAAKKAHDAAGVKSKSDFESPCPTPDCLGTTPKKLALVINGFDTHDSFISYPPRIRDALIKQGYETIYVGADIGESLEKLPSGADKKNYNFATLAGVRAAFADLAGRVNGCCDEVVIYISGHGSRTGGIAINEQTKHMKLIRDPDNPKRGKRVVDYVSGHKDGGDIYTPEWKKMLDTIKTCKTQVIINSCYSGKHIERGLNKDVASDGCLCRTVHISSVSTRPTYAVNWTLQFEKALLAGKSITDGALDAYNKVRDRGFYSNYPFADSTAVGLCEDPDGDRLCTGIENAYGSDPAKKDSDLDGLDDYQEWITRGTDHETDPKKDDTDGDGLKDGYEVGTTKTNPKLKDTDGDGVDDKAEGFATTDPLDADSDDDGCNDGKELYEDHTNPKDKNSHGPSCGELPSGGETSLKIGESHKIGGHVIKLVETYKDNTNNDAETFVITIDGEQIEVVAGQKFVFGEWELTVVTVYPDGKVVIKVLPKN